MGNENLCGWGLLLPTLDPLGAGPRPVLETASRAEELGFDSLWVGDHLLFSVPMLDAVCALSAVSAVTSRIRLGFRVMQLALHPLAWTAKQLATLDAMAPSRILLGIGVGQVPEDEWETAGVDYRSRGRRTDEMIPVLQAMMRGEAVDHPGPLAPVRSRALDPVPGHDLPVLIGGTTDTALRRVARHGDAWLASMIGPDQIPERAARLREFADQQGRPEPEIILVVFCCVSDDVRKDRALAEQYLQAQHSMPFEVMAPFSPIGSEEMIADHLGSLKDAGVSGFVLLPMSADPVEQVERLAPIRAKVLGSALSVS